MAISFDPNLLLSYYQGRAGIPAGSGLPAKKVAPTAPWNQQLKPAAANAAMSKAVTSALAGRKLVDESAAKLDLPGASADYKKLFALYQAINTLSGVADRINAKGLTGAEKARIISTFEKGKVEIAAYVESLKLQKLRLAEGEAATTVKSELTVLKAKPNYVTAPLATGSATTAVAAFAGPVQFNVAVKRSGVTTNVAIDLAGMGTQPRSLANVVNFMNQTLQAAGVLSRFGVERIPGPTKQVKIGTKMVTQPAGPDQFAMKIKADSGEALTFSAPATAGAVYMAQSVGDPNPAPIAANKGLTTTRQLLKFQTDTTTVAAPPQTPGAPNWVDGRVFAKDLGPEIKAVRAQTVGADGSVYMLADVTAKTAGHVLKGDQDVALLKYDSAGKLMFTRTLGAASNATGLALAVAADGKIAVAGAVTGTLTGAADGPINSLPGSKLSDSFVTLYDAAGQELWTQRRGARLEDEASKVAFAADGTVYVAGRAKSGMPGTTAIGGWDSYIEGFRTNATTGKVQTLFTQSFGTTGTDKPAGLVVDGTSLVTASMENGRAVLRRFDVSGVAPVQTAIRDLGDLKGGDLAGLALDGTQIVLAGNTTNAALAAGTVTRAHAGGVDPFAARLSANLTPAAGDAIAYYGGTGDDRVTALSVAGGKVWIAGSAGAAALPGQPPVGKKDGFLTQLDVATGTVAWSRRFTGKDGFAAPTAIAADTKGASVLDRLGLPSGLIDTSESQRITAASSLRDGDQFTVKSGTGRPVTVTIQGTDTLDSLAQKIRRASGFAAKVTITTVDGARRLQIAPMTARSLVEFGPGKTDKNALAQIGIPEGVVRATKMSHGKTVPADGKPMLYGLSLHSTLNLSNPEQIKHTAAELANAMNIVRKAYKDLVAAASPPSPAAAAAGKPGKVPAYLSRQIASYSQALARLTA